jgi:hypothetical protein
MRKTERVAVAVTVAAAIAGALMIATEFSTIAWVDVANESCEVINDSNPSLADRCRLSGFERHGGAFVILGLATLFMAWGAGVGRSRPAAIALVAIGGVVLAIALLSDLPQTGKTGAIGPRFENAKGKTGTGLYLELIGGALAVWSGSLRLAARRAEDRGSPD